MNDEQRRAAEREQEEPRNEETHDERVDDLDVPEDQGKDVKGGGKVNVQDISF